MYFQKSTPQRNSETEKRIYLKNCALKQILRDFEQVCYDYGVKLKTPSFAMTDSKLLLGSWDREKRMISISMHLVENYHWNTVREVLKHEMAHQIADDIFGGHNGHDNVFQSACERIYVESWARSPRVELSPSPPDLDLFAKQADSGESPIARKIEKLLRLSESMNENEASIALAKAVELQQKLHRETGGEQHFPKVFSYSFRTNKKRLDSSYNYIAKILGEFFSVLTIFSSEYSLKDDCEYKTIELVGAGKDILMADHVAHYLLDTTDRLWKYQKATTGKSGLSSRNAYRIGVLQGLYAKLKSLEDERVMRPSRKPEEGFSSNFDHKPTSIITSKPITDLETAHRQAVKEMFQKKFPRVRHSKTRHSSRDVSSYQAGIKAGSSINLRSPISGSQSQKRLGS